MPRPTRRSPAHGRLAGALLAACLLAACSSNDTTDPPRTTTSPPRSTTTTSTTATTTTSTTTPPTPEAAVRTAYLAAMAQFYTALADATLDIAQLAKYRTGRSLAHVRDVVADRRRQGITAQFPTGEPIPAVSAVSVRDSNATLRACIVDNGLQIDAATHAVIDNRTVSELQRAVLVRVDDQWLVSQQTTLARWFDAGGCRR